jgi:ketosteroid isomerase-like protein
MSENSHVATVNRMTQAIFEHDRATLEDIFTSDLTFHMRGCLPRPGDHLGVDGLLDALGAIFVQTDGKVTIQQLSCLAGGEWATEWEHAVLERGDRKLETNNSFIYRFRDDRITEMWMINAELPGAESFWD